MEVTNTNYILRQGSEWQIIITAWEDKVNGTLKTLNVGDLFRMQLRETVDSPTVILSLSSPSAGITFNTSTSEVTITITAVQSAAITAKSMCYDLEYVPLSVEADAVRWLQGAFALSEEVTRA